MIERGLVVAVDPDEHCCWVATQQQSVCANCMIKAGCGRGWSQALRSDTGEQALAVAVSGALPRRGDQVEFSVADHAVLKASFMLYLFPLLAMLISSLGAHALGISEPWLIVFGVSMLFLAHYVCRVLFATGTLTVPQPQLEAVLSSNVDADAVLYSEQ